MNVNEKDLAVLPNAGGGEHRPNRPLESVTWTRSMWFLSGRTSESEPVRYVPIHSSPFVIGRRATCGLHLVCQAVSSAHAEFIDNGATALLRDLGSTNGTYVNGKRVTTEVEVASGDLIQFATVAFRVLKQDSSTSQVTACEDVCDQAMSLVLFDRLITEQAVIPHYQPIVNLRSSAIEGHEVLCRSRLAGLETPIQMFSAATQLDQEARLSQTIRWKACQETMELASPPHLFMNTHPAEVRQPGLLESMQLLRSAAPVAAAHPRDSRSGRHRHRRDEEAQRGTQGPQRPPGLRRFRRGASPDRRADGRSSRLSQVRHVADSQHPSGDGGPPADGRPSGEMVRNLGILALAEGVELEEEAAVCTELGFDMAQGFYFGRPAPIKSAPSLQ